MVQLSHVSFCFLLLQIGIECSKVQAAEGKTDLFLVIIKTNVAINMVPLSTANPSEQMQ